MTRVEAPARLHFGLLSVSATASGGRKPPDGASGEHQGAYAPRSPEFGEREFGGVGLMLEWPRLIVSGKATDRWQVSGPLAERARSFAERMVASLPPDERRPFALAVEQSFPTHAGLGSGTALALAVAKVIAWETGHADWPAIELAVRVGRGLRSAIGVHGFELGGLIVDAGKGPNDSVAPLGGRYQLPDAWRVVLIQAPASTEWEGQKEVRAFAKAGVNPTAALRQLVERQILPALTEGDLGRFGEALHEYNAKAGEAFKDAQGGVYSSPAIAEVIRRVRQSGVGCVGQSSWGPTVFAIVGDEGRAEWLKGQASGWPNAGVRVAPAAKEGARATRSVEARRS